MRPLKRALVGTVKSTMNAATVAAFTNAVVLVACASPFHPAEPLDAGGGGGLQASDGGAASASDASSGDAASSASEAGNDAGATCAAPLREIGNGCRSSDECCSHACDSDRTCAATCVTSGNCAGASLCCIGTYCSEAPMSRCTPCRPAGSDAEVAGGGTVLSKSCCSGLADTATKKCLGP